MKNHQSDALLDPLYREQIQALENMTAAIEGRPAKQVKLSIDEGSIEDGIRKRKIVLKQCSGLGHCGSYRTYKAGADGELHPVSWAHFTGNSKQRRSARRAFIRNYGG